MAESAVFDELGRAVAGVAFDDAPLRKAVRTDGRIYFLGLGRSGCVLRMFAIRVAQMGLACRWVGDVSTTAIRPGDSLVVVSGSGATASTLVLAMAGKRAGAHVVALTATVNSPIAGVADETIVLPGVSKTPGAPQTIASVQPLGSLFEQVLMVFLETCVLRLLGDLSLAVSELAENHANVE